MTKQEAIAYMQERRNTRIAGIYDDDDTLIDAIQVLAPGIEWPDFGELKCGQFLKRYGK